MTNPTLPTPSGTAFGAPGHAPTWTSAAKDTVTTGLGPARLWVTLGRGIINEVYWPSTGTPQLREMTFLVRAGGRWVHIAHANRYEVTYERPDVPLPTIVHEGSSHEGQGYRLTLQVIPDPLRDALLVRYDLQGGEALAVQVSPHLGGTGLGNTAWVTPEAGYATGGGRTLALLAQAERGATSGFSWLSAGFCGVSDVLTDIDTNGETNGGLTWAFERAENGNVGVGGQLAQLSGALALGFSDRDTGARVLAASMLAEGADIVLARTIQGWKTWADTLKWPRKRPQVPPDAPAVAEGDRASAASSKLSQQGHDPLADLARASVAVLKVHEDVTFPGALVASLSLPWGNAREDAGGYHLVWPRDAVQSGLALLAAGQLEDARRVMAYLIAMQGPDGHWAQNFYPNGKAYWSGLQLDETAFPVLLAAALHERGEEPLPGTARMVRQAVNFLTAHGPMSPQDRWEENPGANAFTLATTIAALTAAAPWLEGEQATPGQAQDAQDIADEWNERLESWTYVTGTPLSRQHGVEGYYVRLSPPLDDGGITGRVQVRNRDGITLDASALVSLDYLALARYGLRDPHDPRMQATTSIVDKLLAVETPSGTVYYRYNEDGYGEHEDGSPYDGTGRGRPWPLLAGERGHFALQCGQDPTEYLHTMARCTGPGGLLPEQVWDGPEIPQYNLYPGRPAGSAMPLAWAHAEYLKLYLAYAHGQPFELLKSVVHRYGKKVPTPKAWRWRNDTPVASLPAGRELHVEALRPFTLHFGWDDWQEVAEREAAEVQPGRFAVRFTAAELAAHDTLNFTRRYQTDHDQNGEWEGQNHTVTLQHPHGPLHLHTHSQG